MAEAAATTVITLAEEIPAMIASLAMEEETIVAIRTGEIERITEEKAEDETTNMDMGTPERGEETEEEWLEVVKKYRAKAIGKKGVALKASLLLKNSRTWKRPVKKATPIAKALAARATNAARPARRL